MSGEGWDGTERRKVQAPTQDPPKDDTPGWAHALMDRMAAVERRIPEPRAESDPPKDDKQSGKDADDDDDGIEILSIEEIVNDVQETVPEITHALFHMFGGRKS